MVGADQARDREESRNINPSPAFSCLPQDSLPLPSPLCLQASSSSREWTALFCAREGRGERKAYLSLQSETWDRQEGPCRTLRVWCIENRLIDTAD